MSSGTAALLTLHLVATAAMAGLIWFVQVVHYPLFDAVGTDRFAAYEAQHTRRTSWVVGPLMALEGVTALVVAATLRDEVGFWLTGLGLLLLAAIHGSTVLLQVPAHGRLAAGHDGVVTARLVKTNWIRTFGWTARTVVAGAMIFVAA